MRETTAWQNVEAVYSSQMQWEKVKYKGRCQCHAHGECEGQCQNCCYLFHAGVPLFQPCSDYRDKPRTSVIANTFWSFCAKRVWASEVPGSDVKASVRGRGNRRGCMIDWIIWQAKSTNRPG